LCILGYKYFPSLCSEKEFITSPAPDVFRKNFSWRRLKRVYEIQLPSKEEIISVIRDSRECPEFLDERGLWILENFVGGVK